MTPPSRAREELEAVARLVTACRDSARARRLSGLTYLLDMALVTALADPDGPAPPADARRAPVPSARGGHGAADDDDAQAAGGERAAMDLRAIRATIEACQARAQDLGRSTLAYMLDMALLAVQQGLSD